MQKILVLIVLCLCSIASWAIQPGKGMQELEKKPVAPDFSLKDIDGTIYNKADFAGKVVVVNFWATWCPPCRAEMPSMQRAWKNILEKEGMVMLAIDVGEGEDAIFEFTSVYKADFPILLDEDSSVAESWGVNGLPTTYVMDTQGRLVYRAIGGREWDQPELIEKLRALKTSSPDTRTVKSN